jgi:putative transposase
LKADANHVVSKRIASAHPHALIGLENLTDIRDRTKRRRGKKASKKQRKANAVYSKWAFAQVHAMIAYKALRQASMAIKIDAHYTSQARPMCGHSSTANRHNKGLLLSISSVAIPLLKERTMLPCQGHGNILLSACQQLATIHADLVGARNVALRTLLARQDWARTGRLSIVSDVSSDEAKALQRQRYSELRWSLDTSPAL